MVISSSHLARQARPRLHYRLDRHPAHHSDCRPDKEDPCKGTCVCDTEGINECTCVGKGSTVSGNSVDISKVLARTNKIDIDLDAALNITSESEVPSSCPRLPISVSKIILKYFRILLFLEIIY